MTPDANDLCVFAIKRGQITSRFDYDYCLGETTIHFDACNYIIKFGEIIEAKYRYPTFYGINYKQTGIGIIKGENIDRDGEWINLDSLDHIDDETNQKYRKTILHENDLIMTVRGEVGKVALVTKDIDGCNINANVIRISLKKQINGIHIYPPYIWNYLNSTTGKKQIKKQTAGGVQKTITVSGISDIEIILPEYSKQLSLSKNLEKQSLLRKKNQTDAEYLLNSMDHVILSLLNISPAEYTERLVGAIHLSDLISDSTFSAEYYHTERMAAIHELQSHCELKAKRLANIVVFRRSIVISANSNEEYLGLAGVESQTGELSGIKEEAAGQAFVYQVGDVLYGRLRPYLNKVIVAETSGICSTEFHVMRVIDENEIIPEYLAAIMRSPLILAQTKHMMTGNTHPRISNDDVKNLYIPIPEIDVQRKIALELNKRRKEARKLKEEAEREWADAKARFEKELLGEI